MKLLDWKSQKASYDGGAYAIIIAWFLKFWINQLHKTKIGTKLMRLFGVLYYLTIVLTTREHFLCPHACTTPALACVVDGMMTESLGSVGALSLSQTDGPSIGMKRSAVPTSRYQ